MSVETSCWEITGCSKKDKCLVYKQSVLSGRPCWEVVTSFDDYRNALNVCGDCVVYVMKQTSGVLSVAQIEEIMAKKGADRKCCATLMAS